MENFDEMSQEEIVVELCTNIDTSEYTDDEWDEMYDKLDDEHRAEVDDSLREFANGAVGDDHWNDDD